MIHSIKFPEGFEYDKWYDDGDPRIRVEEYEQTEYVGMGRASSHHKVRKEAYFLEVFKKGYTLCFNPNLNVIIGSNGCGKSTIFTLIEDIVKDNGQYSYANTELDYDKDGKLYILDFLNGKFKDIIEPNPMDNSTFLNDTIALMYEREKSHGEQTSGLYGIFDTIEDNSTIILDEPEMGLSLDNKVKAIEKIKELSKRCQVIMVTHDLMFMAITDTIYDMDKKDYIDSNNFIKKYI